MIGVGPTVEAAAEKFPHEHAAAALERADVAAGVGLTPTRLAADAHEWRVAPAGFVVVRESGVIAGEATGRGVIVEDEIARCGRIRLRMARGATTLEDWANVAVELDVRCAGSVCL